MRELDGKIAVITGAGSGMARATTRVFVREGAKVLAVDVSGREKETADELGDAVVAFGADVTDEAQVAAMFATAIEAFGRVDAVLNVAGIAGAQGLAEVTLDEYDRIMAVDLKGVMLGTKHGVRAMVPTGGGAIVNWSSIGGLRASPMPTSPHSAATAGAIPLTTAAAVEYGSTGTRAPRHRQLSWAQAARPPRERPVAGHGQRRAPRTGGAADRRRPHRRRGADVGARGGRGARPR